VGRAGVRVLIALDFFVGFVFLLQSGFFQPLLWVELGVDGHVAQFFLLPQQRVVRLFDVFGLGWVVGLFDVFGLGWVVGLFDVFGLGWVVGLFDVFWLVRLLRFGARTREPPLARAASRVAATRSPIDPYLIDPCSDPKDR
jgi:hypothetical protein